MKKKAVVYARVSTDREEQEASLESQKEYYAEYAVEEGFDFLRVYYDEGLTATNSNRKYFIKMLEDAGLDSVRIDSNRFIFSASNRDPLFNWIIIKDASRFARNVNAVDIVRTLRDKEVFIEFEALGFTTEDIDWEFRLGLFLTFSQEESLSTSRKIRDAYLKRAKKGKFHMSVNLLGYARDKKTKEYYIVEEQAEMVRKIFDYYTIDKIGGHEIGDRLNEQGYTTKQGRRWNNTAVSRVLNNEKYKGQVILNRYGKTDLTGSNRRVINPRDEWIIHDDAIPKIVSVEQFDEAQRIMTTRTHVTVKKKNGTNKRQVRGKKVIKNVFHQKIVCGRCGGYYIRESATKIRKGVKVTEYFYGCRNRRNTQRNTEKCMSRGISHDVLVRELLKIGKRMNLIDLDDETLVIEQIALKDKLNEIDRLIEDSDKEKSKIDDEVKKIDLQINNLFNTLSSGVTDRVVKMTHDKIEELENEQKQLEVGKVSFDVIELENKKKMYNDKFDEIVELSKKDTYTFDEILKQIYEIEMFTDNKVIVKFKVPTLRMEDDTKRLVHFMFER